MEEYIENLIKTGWINREEAGKLFTDGLKNEIEKCKCPKPGEVFNAFKGLKPQDVKALIIGQDPYPSDEDAHGLAFSSKAKKTPASLEKIFNKIEQGFSGEKINRTKNNLEPWRKQGVLLLNSALTFKENSDKDLRRRIKLWEPFVSNVIKKLLTSGNKPLVVMLWGSKAQNVYKKCCKNVDTKRKIKVLKSYHPQARIKDENENSFANSRQNHFKDCNEFLNENKITKIDWRKTC